MEVNTNITAADVEAFQRFCMRRVAKLTRSASAGTFWKPLLFGFGLGLPIAFGWTVFGLPLHLPTAVLTLLFVSAYLWFYKRGLPAVPTTDKNGCALGPKLVTVDDTGVRQVDNRHSALTRWAGVLDIHDDAQHVFLMIDRFAGYVVPKRSFGSVEEAARFVSFARDRSSAQCWG